MKRQVIPAGLTALFLALILACVFIRNRSDLYVVTNLEGHDSAVGYAYALAADGQVAGYVEAVPGIRGHGFVYGSAGKKALSAPAVRSEAHGLNAYGVVVGCIYDKAAFVRACRFRNGKIEDLGTLGGRYAKANAVNAAGRIAGFSSCGNGRHHAFLYTDGHMNDIGTLGGVSSEAQSINDRDQIVGSAQTADVCNHAFLYSDGHMQDLGTLGGDSSVAFAIDNVGQVVGYSDTAEGATHAFLYQNGVMQDLGVLTPTACSYAYGVNARGEVVGSSDAGNDEAHAFLYKDGRMKDLNSLLPAHSGWVLNEARAINDKGQIVGFGTFNGKTRAFLLTPQ